MSRSGVIARDLDLLVDHLAGKAVKFHACRAEGRRCDRRRVQPVTLFSFDDEFVWLGEVGGVRRISPCLRDNLAVEVVYRESRPAAPIHLTWSPRT